MCGSPVNVEPLANPVSSVVVRTCGVSYYPLMRRGVQVVHRTGARAGEVIEPSEPRITLGRAKSSDVQVPERCVSAAHAFMEVVGDAWEIEDLGSRNGTFVNGRRVQQRERLKHGDIIQLGIDGPLLEVRLEGSGPLPPALVARGALGGRWLLAPGTHLIGSALPATIILADQKIARAHARVEATATTLTIQDLGSLTGTWVNGARAVSASLHHGDVVRIGPSASLVVDWPSGPARAPSPSGVTAALLEKLEHAASSGEGGTRTLRLLRLAKGFHRRRRMPLLVACGVLLAVALSVAVHARMQARRIERLTALAGDAFNQIRLIDAEIVRLKSRMADAELAQLVQKRDQLVDTYEQAVETIGVTEGKSPQELAIMQMSRRLGESELDLPDGFSDAVMDYVRRWQCTKRLRAAMSRARERDLGPRIVAALEERGLPSELAFIPLQESDFDARRVGPATRFGIAKGMWQLIPPTATQYGLRTGPLAEVREFDAGDERHDEDLSTKAAVGYLADLYTTEAAASGLLVMASYNYGQTRVIKRLRRLPDEPEERSFWNFYRQGWLPKETRDYVMYIFAAALILEQPELFGVTVEPLVNVPPVADR